MVYAAVNGHLQVVSALLDTFFPALPQEAEAARGEGKHAEATFLATPGSRDPRIAQLVLEAVDELPPETQRKLRLIFTLLEWRLGTLLLGGTASLSSMPPFVQPFTELDPAARESVLQGWAMSSIPQILQAFKGIKSLLMSTVFSYTNSKGQNIFWPGIQYAGPDPRRPEMPSEGKLRSEKAICAASIHLNDCKDAGGLRESLEALGLPDQGSINGQSDEHVETECDVVVIGSGAGGGVAACLLAQAGAKVLVVEKGRYTKAADLSLLERDAFQNMYEGCGLATTDDAGINILAGATLGGGTRINWSASFATPAHVRKEWAEEHGLTAFQSPEYDAALEAISSRLGVTTGIVEHSRANVKLKEGLQKLGVHYGEIPRNTGTGHSCGHCSFGCAHGEKQDGTATFLADAVEAGAKIITGAFAEKVLVTDSPQGCRQPQTVQGVVIRSQRTPGTAVGRPELHLTVRCKRVICSAGALHTPALLLRSGITAGGQVGKHLHLHPATVVPALFPKEEGPVLGWDGAIMSTYSSEVADWEGSGYGPLLATPSAHPGLTAASFPWPSGPAYKMRALQFPYTAGALVYARDRDSGEVYLGADGLPRFKYWPSAGDRDSMMKGMVLGLRAMVAAGAESVMVLYTGQQVVFRPEFKDGSLMNAAAFEDYLREVQQRGIHLNSLAILTAHQMGSARMGVARQASAVDANGEAWDVQNLFVADAALMPTSTGVNPMITVEATVWMLMARLTSYAMSVTRRRTKDGKKRNIFSQGRYPS
ncbi:g9925 [Coccomyxa viridis]|uniref:Long-chain-alcohol oxidase n=1 Tax=Coccomyxa viridis TaxID=1274662 RepID=A0ABP1G482_9CHLO